METPKDVVDLAIVSPDHSTLDSAVKAAGLVETLKDGQKVKTLEGGELSVSVKDGKVMINGANVTAADLEGSNGVVHVIDAVLMPAN